MVRISSAFPNTPKPINMMKASPRPRSLSTTPDMPIQSHHEPVHTSPSSEYTPQENYTESSSTAQQPCAVLLPVAGSYPLENSIPIKSDQCWAGSTDLGLDSRNFRARFDQFRAACDQVWSGFDQVGGGLGDHGLGLTQTWLGSTTLAAALDCVCVDNLLTGLEPLWWRRLDAFWAEGLGPGFNHIWAKLEHFKSVLNRLGDGFDTPNTIQEPWRT